MFQKNNRFWVTFPIALVVAAIIVGALSLSALAVQENIRFMRGADQIGQLVALVRSVAATQRNFAQNPGEDVWAALDHMGQIIQASSHYNPWQGEIRASVITNAAIRIETDLPARDCRRLALSYLDNPPAGWLGLQAQGAGDQVWNPIYPAPAQHPRGLSLVEAACGKGMAAHLAFIFQIR